MLDLQNQGTLPCYDARARRSAGPGEAQYQGQKRLSGNSRPLDKLEPILTTFMFLVIDADIGSARLGKTREPFQPPLCGAMNSLPI